MTMKITRCGSQSNNRRNQELAKGRAYVNSTASGVKLTLLCQRDHDCTHDPTCLHDYNVELDADEIERCFQLRSQHRQPTHPGAILRQEYLTARRVSESRLATDIGVSQRRVKDIVKGKRSITPDTALRLERYFGTSARYWLDLQASYNLEIERVRLGDSLEHEVLVHAEAS